MTEPLSLAHLETLREGWDFEAKLAAGKDAKGTIPKSFWETYAAMANTEGGAILLGAKERPDHSLQFVGLPDPHRVETDLWNGLSNPQLVSDSTLSQDNVSIITEGTTSMLLIQVPKAQHHQRPVYLRGNVETGTYIRVHEGDRKVSPEQARRMLADRIDKRDERVLEHFTADDLDPETVAGYRAVFTARRRGGHPFSTDEGRDFLLSIGAWGRDREAGIEGVTLAGLLMLGRESAIRDRYSHWHLSYREEEPNSERWSDRVSTDGSWAGNLFSFYQRIIPKLTSGVKVPFAVGPGGYRDDDGPVHVALREAFVNTLIHADYAGPGGIRIIRRSHGFEFINPGLALIPVERIWQGGTTVARNPRLQRLFGLINLGEREGSGGPAIFKAWQSQQWQLPMMRQDFEHQETHLTLSQVSLLPAESLEALTEEWGDAFTGLGELGRLVVTTAHAEGGVITHQRLRELTDAHSRTITLKLQEIVKAGFLESSGGGRGTKYHLKNRDQSQGSLFRWRDSQSSPTSTPSSLASTPNSPASTPNSPASTPSSPVRAADDAVVAEVAERRRSRPEEVEAAILALAGPGFISIGELTSRLNRTASTLQPYLTTLLRDGRLAAKFPERRTHPKQAYRATDQDDPTA